MITRQEHYKKEAERLLELAKEIHEELGASYGLVNARSPYTKYLILKEYDV